MAVEPKRGCGYRKQGGLYLVSGGTGMPCDRLPIRLDVCPVCSHGFKQSRGFTWVDLFGLVGGAHDNCNCFDGCPLCFNPKSIGKGGLLWIGAKFYKTAADFLKEGIEMGFSRRIGALPRNFKVGETWVLLAHPQHVGCDVCQGTGLPPESLVGELSRETVATEETAKCETCKGTGKLPGIFFVWRPERVEKILPESKRDSEEVAELVKQGITPVFVPDDDPDHKGSVHDKAEEDVEEEEEVRI